MKYKSLVIYHKYTVKKKKTEAKQLGYLTPTIQSVGKLETDLIFSAVFLSVCPHHSGAQTSLINVEEASAELKKAVQTFLSLDY